MKISKNQPLVSIGIPTYNRADSYLKLTLESAVNQTYSNIEIVVSDNCSHDNTEDVVKSFNDSRIRYFKQSKNIGGFNNSNFCLKQTKGDYFLQLHDDDMIDHDFIEACMKAANYTTDVGIIRTGTRVIDADNKILQESRNVAAGLSNTEFIRCWYAHSTSIYLCSTLYNTDRLKEIGGFEENLFDDVIAIVHLMKFGRVGIEDVKASFRKHAGEMTFASDIKDWCKDSMYVVDLICGNVPEQYRETVRKEGIKSFAIMIYNFARVIQSPVKRSLSYFEVFRTFNFRHLPPPVRKIFLYINPLHLLRSMMNKNSNVMYTFNLKTAARFLLRFKSCLKNPPNYWRTLEYELVLNEGNFKKEDVILDIASPKSLALYLAKAIGARVTSVDIDDYFMEDMNFLMHLEGISADQLHLKIEDGRNLSFDDKHFNKIYSISVVEHIPGEGDTECMKEMSRVLAKGGKCILTVPFSPVPKVDYRKEKAFYWADNYSGTEKGMVFYERRYSEQELYDRIINPSGLTVEKLQYIGEKVFIDSDKELIDVLPKWTGPIQPFLSKLFLTRPVDSWKSLKKPLCAFIVLKKE